MKTAERQRPGSTEADELWLARPGRRFVAAVVALALAAGGISLAVVAFRGADGGPATGSVLPENGPIALATGDPPRVAVVDPEGTAVRPVTTGKEPDPRAEETGYFEESFPQWSPDGTQLAFVRWYDPGTSLCLINLDGSGFRILVPDLDGGQLAWSPDGTTFAYSSGRDHTIHLVDSDGTDDRVLPGLPEVAGGDPPNWLPAWSPDSAAIAFTSKDLWTIRTDGTGLTRITDLPWDQFAFEPSWSPDGTRIVFSIGAWAGGGGGGAQGGGRLYLASPSGSVGESSVGGRVLAPPTQGACRGGRARNRGVADAGEIRRR